MISHALAEVKLMHILSNVIQKCLVLNLKHWSYALVTPALMKGFKSTQVKAQDVCKTFITKLHAATPSSWSAKKK